MPRVFSLATLLFTMTATVANAADYTTIEFPSADGLTITADLYQAGTGSASKGSAPKGSAAKGSASKGSGAKGAGKPFIVLCHQAGWSRGEYRETAPRLVAMGFDCLAIDQRSGGQTEGVVNETAKRATAAGKPTDFTAAEQDIIAALKYAKANHAHGKLILWGSSYSSSLALRIAGEHPELVDVVLAFAPGEYFGRSGKPNNWIAQSAAKIRVPAFITSAKREAGSWSAIYNAIPGNQKQSFLPQTAGNHGSRALWKRFGDSDAYWAAVTAFLQTLKTS